jgi:hypothetical protein
MLIFKRRKLFHYLGDYKEEDLETPPQKKKKKNFLVYLKKKK